MANGSFKKQGNAKTAGSTPGPGLLIAGWLGSMVLVAILTVVLTSNGDDQAEAPVQVVEAPSEPPAEGDAAPVEPSPDAEIESSAPSGQVAARDQGAAQEADERKFMPMLQLVGPTGIVRLASASLPPSEMVASWCQDLAQRVVDVSSEDCMSGAFTDSGHVSVDGRPLILRNVAPDAEPARGRVLLLAAVHGDELSSVGAAFGWMNLMDENGTPYRWHVAPVVNPDGLFHEPPTRVNANGVDLNRNLPTEGWDTESRDYWRRVGFEKRRFPGETAGSEPENKWLAQEIREFQPDVIISLHAPYGVLDYDGDFEAPRSLGRLDLHRLGVYPGSLGNFASRMQGIPVITVELEESDAAPESEEIQQMWADLNNWLDRYMTSTRQASAEAATNDAG